MGGRTQGLHVCMVGAVTYAYALCSGLSWGLSAYGVGRWGCWVMATMRGGNPSDAVPLSVSSRGVPGGAWATRCGGRGSWHPADGALTVGHPDASWPHVRSS